MEWRQLFWFIYKRAEQYINKWAVNPFIYWVRMKIGRISLVEQVFYLSNAYGSITQGPFQSRAHFSNETHISVKGRLKIKNPRHLFKNAGIKIMYHFCIKETSFPNMIPFCISLQHDYP